MYSVLMYDNDEDKKCFMANIAKELAVAEKKLEKSKIMGFVAQIILSRQQVMIDFFEKYLGKKRSKRSKKSKKGKNNEKSTTTKEKKPKGGGSKYWKKFLALVKPPLKLKKKPLKELKKCFEELTKTTPKIKRPGFIVSKKSIADIGKDSNKKPQYS